MRITNGTFRQNLVYWLCGRIGKLHQRLLSTIAPTWRSADGKVQFVTDMPYEHLNNSYNMLKRRGSTSPMLRILFRELTTRDRIRAKEAAVMAPKRDLCRFRMVSGPKEDLWLSYQPETGTLTLTGRHADGESIKLSEAAARELAESGIVTYNSAGWKLRADTDGLTLQAPWVAGAVLWAGDSQKAREAIRELLPPAPEPIDAVAPAVYDGLPSNTTNDEDT